MPTNRPTRQTLPHKTNNPVTYDQFENTLQDWLDEGRLDEADHLLDAVRPADRPRCAELLKTYRALFASLPVALHSDQPFTPSRHRPKSLPGPYVAAPRAAWGMALALGLAVLVMLPDWRNAARTVPADSVSRELVSFPPHGDSSLEVATRAGISERDQHFTRFAATSFEPLARNMVTRTDGAFKSLGQFVVTLNPIDDHLTAYREAAPLIGTLTRGFMPGTHSLGDAFSVLQESALLPTCPVSPAEADSSADSPLSTRA